MADVEKSKSTPPRAPVAPEAAPAVPDSAAPTSSARRETQTELPIAKDAAAASDKGGDLPTPESVDPPLVAGVDIDALRLSQNFREQIGVTKALGRVPVRRPTRQEFVRVRDDDSYRMDTALLELKDENEYYLLTPDVREAMPGEWFPARLVTAINRQGVVFLWPLKLAGSDGQTNSWYDTAIEAAELATKKWVKVVADKSLGGYQTYIANGNLSEPEWPEHKFERLLEVAFRDRIVRSMDHPVIRRLLGDE
ncbi:MAG: hypothetical protein AMXMBFR8_25940 [Nevskiales bacterium]